MTFPPRSLPRPPSWLLMVVVAVATGACRDIPTETVSLCLPEGADCDAFLARQATVTASFERGDPVFQTQCASCHGKDGRGMGIPGRGDFSDPAWHPKWSDSDLEGIITAGKGMKMPAFKLSPIELKSVVLVVRRFNRERGQSDAVIAPPIGQGPYDPKNAEPR